MRLEKVLFYLLLPLLYFISMLPFRVLYWVSDGLYMLIYYGIGYRKSVVRQNLLNSFPEKSSEEIVAIEKKFYAYFCDVLVETIKLLTINEEQTRAHCFMRDNSLFCKAADQGKSVVLVLGHYGNWEFAALGMSLAWNHPIIVIYQPLSQESFENLIYRTRSKFGAVLVPKSKVFRHIIGQKNITAYTFVADQTPLPKVAYWTTFLNQDTPVFQGPEKIAKKLNIPVLYAVMHRTSRGVYEMVAETLVENPTLTDDGEITEAFTRRLEQDIRKNPAYWLWTHNRWKQKRLPEQVPSASDNEATSSLAS